MDICWSTGTAQDAAWKYHNNLQNYKREKIKWTQTQQQRARDSDDSKQLDCNAKGEAIARSSHAQTNNTPSPFVWCWRKDLHSLMSKKQLLYRFQWHSSNTKKSCRFYHLYFFTGDEHTVSCTKKTPYNHPNDTILSWGHSLLWNKTSI